MGIVSVRESMLRHTISLLILLLSLSIIMLAGCEGLPQTPALINYFNDSWTSETGQAIRISGYSGGHQAGNQSEFQVQFDNQSQKEAWSDQYRIILVDHASAQEWEISQGTFKVQAGSATTFPVIVDFPATISGSLRLNVITGNSTWFGVQLNIGELKES